VIPRATVLVEELAFRGVVYGLLQRLTSPMRATVAGAVLFGLWHVFPAWRGGAAGDLEVGRAATAAGTFAATTAAGFAFVLLRRRSGSLVAPVMLHLATNSVTFAVAWQLS
jgi:membrane protease YdiL (CAAX protease family)